MADSNLADPKDKLIMVVDDEEDILELLRFNAQQEGFKVSTAASGIEGLGKITSLMPDLILLDLMLPRYGGYEVLRQLQNTGTSHIPIIVITGRYKDRSTTDMIRQESNVVDFILKPIDMSYLRKAWHKILKTQPPARTSRK